LRSRSVLTFYYAGLRQRSLHGRRLGLSLGDGSGLLSGWRGTLFSNCCTGFIPLPGQVCGFPAQYMIGCQPSTTTKLHVLLREDIHLQARPDYCHGWGAKYAGNVDKSGLSRRLFFGFSSHRLFSSRSCGWLSPALSNWRLRHAFYHGEGWAAASFSWLPNCILVAFVSLVYGVGRRNLLQATEFCRQHTQLRQTSTRLPYSRSLPLEMWSQ
jgi:hypothetical protein